MDNALHYLALNRQVGLKHEMDIIANNLANLDTTGFRREGVSFTEFVLSAANEDSVSMADTGARYILDRSGELTETNAAFDLAIEGPGYFMVQGPEGTILTRAGRFQISQDGILTTPNGMPVLDTGGAQIPIAIDAKDIEISEDGTLSASTGPIAQIGIADVDAVSLKRYGDTAFSLGDAAFTAVADPKVRQGALESSNVDPVLEIARMIEVTRAYEMAQSVIQDEDERVRETIRTLSENV